MYRLQAAQKEADDHCRRDRRCQRNALAIANLLDLDPPEFTCDAMHRREDREQYCEGKRTTDANPQEGDRQES